MTALDTALTIDDLEQIALAALEPSARDYYRSGSDDELTLARNRSAWQALSFAYRVLVDVSQRSLATTVLGDPIASPILVAPTAFHKLATPDGELATVRAAGAAGTVMINSTLSNTRVEDVVAAATGPVWFQLYVYRDRAATEALVARARDAGCRALVLTVDAPLLGTRERDKRNGFTLPAGLAIENMLAAGLAKLPAAALESGLQSYFASAIDPTLTVDDIAWLASLSELPVVVKGVVRGDDAVRILQAGAKAIVVSNHGGRQLDTSIPTAQALPQVVTAVRDQLGDTGEIYVDGGIRRGTDILKALALGARAVMLGRPILWGLAAGGQQGATRALTMLRNELDLALALAGCSDVTAIPRDLVV
ncbi:MAG: alpha-hydroxy acid oxidase [Polyangiaceae bacterium]